MKIVNTPMLRRRLGAVMDEVVKTNEPVAVYRANKPLVVMMSYLEFQVNFDVQDRQKRLKIL